MTRSWSNLAFLILAFPVFVTLWYVLPEPRRVSNDNALPETSNRLYYESFPTNLSVLLNQLPDNDYGQLIDLNFTFNILNLACNDSSPLLLILVHSSPGNFGKRKTIRNTWGQHNDKIKLLFALGSITNSELQKKLELENKKYNDFIQGSFLDTYRNMTYKHVMLFKYVLYHCLDAKYILKTDDDMFVNMPLMINFLTNDLSPYGISRMLLCTPIYKAKVIRTYRSKWRVSFSEYQGKEYPTYCPGWFLLYSPDVVFGLYRQAQKHPYFWIDDVHIAGTLFKTLHLIHSNVESYKIKDDDLKKIEKAYDDKLSMAEVNATKPFLIGPENINQNQIFSLWSYVQAHYVPKSLFILKDT